MTDRVDRGLAVGQIVPLPLGAVVAVCDLVDVVPIHSYMHREPRVGNYLLNEVGGLGRRVLGLYRPDGHGIAHVNGNAHEHPWVAAHDDETMTEQLPFGDFSPGRYAWLLGNVRPLAEPVPCKGRQGLWTLPEDIAQRVQTELTDAEAS